MEGNTSTDGDQVVLVTGGAGFLGRAIVHELITAERHGFTLPAQVRVLDVRPFEAFDHPKVVSIVADIRSYDEALQACQGVDVVIHSAAIIDWGFEPEELLEAVNLRGTENVIRCCQEAGVRGLVYTSTMDVVYNGKPIRNADETLPYPERFSMGYARTKALAEQAAIRANGAKRNPRKGEEQADPRLYTCVIRPCGMFGEADPYHVTQAIRALQAGLLRFRMGSGDAVFQHVYVGNVAYAHLLAMKRLLEPGSPVAGEIYLITDEPAVNAFDFLDRIMTPLGYPFPPKGRSIPYPIMYMLGTLVELAAWVCRPFYKLQPAFTRASVDMLCQDLSFVGDKARRDLGYEPIYSVGESISRTVDFFKSQGPV